MSNAMIGLASVCFAVAYAITWLMRQIALKRGIIDHPNERSSHAIPTPRGGGVAIVLAATAGFGVLLIAGELSLPFFLALVVGGSAVAMAGFVDDLRSLPAWIRLLVHIAAAAWAVGWLTAGESSAQWYFHVLYVLCIVWFVNLFNFMDGIDGLAGMEAAFIAFGGALLLWLAGASAALVCVALMFGAACIGFLLWNWPPAKIFMGDVGSGYLGYVIAVIGLFSGPLQVSLLSGWLLLAGYFASDATITLLSRLFRGERIYTPHRSHLYQILSRRWGSHRRVTLAVTALNLCWLLPLAIAAVLVPAWALCFVLLGTVPLALACLLIGAGRAS